MTYCRSRTARPVALLLPPAITMPIFRFSIHTDSLRIELAISSAPVTSRRSATAREIDGAARRECFASYRQMFFFASYASASNV